MISFFLILKKDSTTSLQSWMEKFHKHSLYHLAIRSHSTDYVEWTNCHMKDLYYFLHLGFEQWCKSVLQFTTALYNSTPLQRRAANLQKIFPPFCWKNFCIKSKFSVSLNLFQIILKTFIMTTSYSSGESHGHIALAGDRQCSETVVDLLSTMSAYYYHVVDWFCWFFCG